MARKVEISLVDDIDGGEASGTVEFALDGVAYEIDLSDTNAQALRDQLAPYIGEGRKVSGRRRSSGGRASGRSRSAGGTDAPASEVREWARGNGYDVPDRGRVSAEVKQAYAAAH